MKRSFGVLMPVFSLPNAYGIGSFGKEAYKFIDYIKEMGASFWQMLPLNETSFGNSPYQSFSSESISPYYISLEILYSEGLITKKDLNAQKRSEKLVDYGDLYYNRLPLLKKAFLKFDKENEDFKAFVKKKSFLSYALFMAIKDSKNGASFDVWEEELKHRDKKALDKFYKKNKEAVLFRQWLQFTALTQYTMLKGYANSVGIKIIGDIPLYTSYDSVDVWENPSLYKLDENLVPKKVAGVPPDYFSKDGQLWGNPVYDYEEHKKSGFIWWKNRIKKALSLYDIVRIDHFRGLDRFYEIPYGEKTAKKGEWVQVPYKELFSSLKTVIGKDRIIAEDLGVLDDGVYNLLSYTGFPGMCVLSFAFDSEKDNKYLPENIKENSVCYTGTHDNDTLVSLLSSLTAWDMNNFLTGVKESLARFKKKSKLNSIDKLADKIIELGFMCKADTFIIPFSDITKKGTDYRINEPSTDKPQNWSVRFTRFDFKKKYVKKYKKLAEKFGR